MVEDKEGKNEPKKSSVTEYSPQEGETVGPLTPGTMDFSNVLPSMHMLTCNTLQKRGFLACICTHFHRYTDIIGNIREGTRNLSSDLKNISLFKKIFLFIFNLHRIVFKIAATLNHILYLKESSAFDHGSNAGTFV